MLTLILFLCAAIWMACGCLGRKRLRQAPRAPIAHARASCCEVYTIPTSSAASAASYIHSRRLEDMLAGTHSSMVWKIIFNVLIFWSNRKLKYTKFRAKLPFTYSDNRLMLPTIYKAIIEEGSTCYFFRYRIKRPISNLPCNSPMNLLIIDCIIVFEGILLLLK